MPRIELSATARKDLERLDKPIQIRIVNRLRWLAENLEHVQTEQLKGGFSGTFKLRVGDYRLVYRREADEDVVLVLRIGHRREVYRTK